MSSFDEYRKKMQEKYGTASSKIKTNESGGRRGGRSTDEGGEGKEYKSTPKSFEDIRNEMKDKYGKEYSEESKAGWQKYLDDQKAATEKEDETFWEKIGRYLSGGTPDTSLPMGTTSQVINDLRQDDSYKLPSDDWSYEQKYAFGELYISDPEKAYKYAEETNNSINKAKEEAKIKEIQESATDSFGAGFGHTLGAIVTTPLGLADYLNDLAMANAGRDITSDGNVSPFEYSQAVTEGVSTHLNEKGGVIDERVPIIGGKGWGDVYGLGTSIAQSALSAYTLGGAGTLVFYFGQGAASGVDDALSRGASEEQAVRYGTALGTFEGVAEMIGIDNLFKIGSSTTIKEALKNVLKQAGAEGLEEGLTSVLDNIADQWIMQDKSELSLQLNEYMSQGMSESEAKWKVFMNSIEGIAYDTLGGFVSGGVHAGAHTGVQSAISNHNASKLYGDKSQMLIDDALSVKNNSELRSLAEKYKGRVDGGKNLTGGQINRLIEASDTAKLKNFILQRLGELGETGDVTPIADALVKQAIGEELTLKEKKFLNDNNNAHIIAAEMNEDNIQSGGLGNKWAESIGTIRIKPESYNKQLYDLARDVSGVREAKEQNAVAKSKADFENATGAKFKASKSGKTKYENADVTIGKVVSTDGGLKVELDNGKTVNASDVEFGSGAEAMMYEMVARMEVPVDTANEILNAYKPTTAKQAAMYFHNVPLAYKYGTINHEAGLRNINMSESEKRLAFTRGKKDAERKAESNTKTASPNSEKTAPTKKNGIIYEDGFTYDETSANEMQKVSMAHIEVIDKLSNLEVHVFDSKVVNGKRVAYVNGKLVSAPNGYFTDGNKIYIDFSAGNNAEGAMLYTMSHEITHYIRKWNEKGFKELADFLIEQYGKNKVSVTYLIEKQKEKIEKRYKNEGKALPGDAKLFDMAYEELVADAMSDMFADPLAYEKLAKLKQQNKTLWQKFGEAIKAVLDKLKSALGIYKTEQDRIAVAQEAHEVRAFSKEVYEKLQDLYIKAFVEADANYEAFIGSRDINDFAKAMKKPMDNVTNVNIIASSEDMKLSDRENSDIQYSVREIIGDSGKNYGIGVYLDSTFLSSLTDGERVGKVKEHLKKIGGSVFTAYDNNGNEVDVHIVESHKKFKNARGRKVFVNQHLTDYLKNPVKQEAIALVDELIFTAKYENSEPAHSTHGWLDNSGKNDWDTWTTYLQDKENTVWKAILHIANSKNGEKILYEIHPIEMVEGIGKPDTTTTNNRISQSEENVNRQNSDSEEKYSDRDDFNQAKSNLQKKYKIDANDVLALADKYLGNYTVSSSKTNIRLQFLRVAEPLAKIFTTGNTDLLQEATNRAEALASDIEQARSTGTDQDLVAIKNYLRKTNIQIPTFYKAEFDRFGGLNEFRKKHMGKFILSKNGIQVDVLYPELQGLFGTVWFPDIDTVPDQLMRIAEVTDASTESIIATDYDMDAAIEYTREEIMSELSNLVMKSIDKQSRIHIDYRDPNAVSNRTLLANALDSIAQNDIEKNKLNQYKNKITLIESEQKKLAEIRAKANEIRFTKGRTPAETKHMRDLDAEANQIANRISTYDKQLLNLESTTALKNVLEREKTMLRKKLDQKGKEALRAQKEKNAKTVKELMTRYQESRTKAIEGRHKTEMRHKIKNVVSDLNQLLLHGSKERNVKVGLQQAVASALEAINMDTVSAESRIAKLTEELMKAKTPEKIEQIQHSIDYIKNMGDKMSDKLEALRRAYSEIKNSADNEYSAQFKEEASLIEMRIESVIKKVGNTPLRDMSLYQLEQVHDMYKMVLTTIRNANSVWKNGKLEDLQQNASAVMEEIDALPKIKEEGSKATEIIRSFKWNEMTPYYAFDRIGSKTLMSFFNELIRGQNTYARDVAESKAFADKTREKYNYNKWKLDEVHDFKLKDGRTFRTTLKHMLSVYAYSKRDQALDHMSVGGFFHNDKATFRKKGGILEMVRIDEVGYKIDADILAEIKDAMTSDQINYVDEMLGYLTKMGDKGNEVTRVLWGIDIFKEKIYFPLKSKNDFIKKSTETAQNVSLKNDGMTKETVPGASNPIVLEAFDDVWATHIDRMSQYHAFVIPIDNLNKIHQYGTWSGTDSMAVSTMLAGRFGSAVNEYITQFIKDLNGGIASQGASNPFMSMFSKFKKTAVGASLSTVVQQPTAIIRAMSLVDAKYFVGKPNLVKLSSKWEELKTYAPIAIIKEIGGFDAGGGKQAARWINTDALTGIDKVMNTVDDISMKGAEVADKIGWTAIWEAVKREVKATTNLTVGSKEFLDRCGERFTEVIVQTQVYDSTLSRSGFMRSKNDGVKMLTAFMGEPTLSINMMYNAVVNAKRGGKGAKLKAAKTIGSVYLATIFASALASAIYALRDDDEDESYLEKYLQSLGGEVVSDIVLAPITSLPGVKDIVSIFQGWDIERSDMAIFKDIKDAFDGLGSENKSTYRKIEDFAGAIASAFGLPLKNVLRTGREVYNAVENSFDGISGGNAWDAFKEGVTGKDTPKQDGLYDAIVNGDESRLELLKKTYKTADAYETAVRKALREHDSRIKEAAQARLDGDISAYTRIAKEIIGEGYFSQDTVVGAINAEMTAIKKGESSGTETTEDKDEATSIYKASDVNVALDNGDTDLALQIIDDLIETKVANGMEEKNAKSSVRSSMTSYWKPLYKQAYQSGNTTEMTRIRRILLSSGLYGTSNDVVKTVKNWLKS